jgi:capsular exopolysaccharide synthesis family protein
MPQNHFDNSNYPSPARQIAVSRSLTGLYARDLVSARGDGQGENIISPSFLLWVLQQWWKIGVPVGLALAIIAGVAVMYFYVPTFKATALIMIEDTTPYVAFTGNSVDGSRSYVATQTELLRSPVVLESVLTRPEVASMAELAGKPNRVKHLQKYLKVERITTSELYNVTFESYSARDAANVANAVVAAYLNLQKNDEEQRSKAVIDLLDEERTRRGVEVQRLRKRVIDLSKDVTGMDPFAGSVTDFQRALNPVGALFQSLIEVDVEREVLQAKLQSLSAAAVSPRDPLESNGGLELEVENQTEVRQRQEEIQAVQARIDVLKSYARKGQLASNPNYQTLMKDLEHRQKQLADTRERVRAQILETRKLEREYNRGQELTRIRTELESVEARKALLTRKYETQVREMQSGDGKSVELEFARAELEREQRVFELIASRRLALQTEMRAPARVSLTRAADVPATPDEPVPYKLLLLACSLAFATPFAAAIGKESLVRRITDIDQLAHESKLRVLGDISALPVRHVAISPKKLAGRLRRESYIFAESINSLRTNLAVAESLNDQLVIAVTSSVSGEGKTSVATSLAMSIMNATDLPTLIIDADMRSPDVATILKTRSRPGLFDLLSNKCELDDAIHRVNESNLYVIPGGRATRNPHHIVGVAATKQLLDQLRTRFNAIVIDTPPILGASESLIFAKACDAALFCTRCDYSRVKQVRMAVERLEHAGVTLAGAVLSGTPAKRYAYLYGYYENRGELSE